MTDIPPKPQPGPLDPPSPGVYPPPPDSAHPPPPPPPHKVPPREQWRERRTLILVAIAAVVIIALYLMLFAHEVRSQPVQCGPRDDVANTLDRKYGEVPIFVAVNAKSNMVEIFASPGRTWTYVLTTPDGVACIVDSGESIEALKPPPDEDI